MVDHIVERLNRKVLTSKCAIYRRQIFDERAFDACKVNSNIRVHIIIHRNLKLEGRGLEQLKMLLEMMMESLFVHDDQVYAWLQNESEIDLRTFLRIVQPEVCCAGEYKVIWIIWVDQFGPLFFSVFY